VYWILPDPIDRQLARIVSSPGFAGSPRMVRFLVFAVHETLRGNAGELKEIVIGSSVFDRDSGYDTRLDPIVRVEARRLRTKLKAYYETEGRHDAIVIDLPRGSYVPVFRRPSEGMFPAIEPQPQEFESIAVLPFRNLDEGHDSAYFAAGLAEELIHALTRVPRLRVVAWNSASWLREPGAGMEAVPQNLNAAYILRGSLRKTGRRLRIAAQLVQTATGHYLWSETWERRVRDVFTVQEQVATAIANSLRARILNEV
jgi:serine/threonine-protein kinase